VERLLRQERRKQRLKGRSTTKKGTLLKNQIPVRVFWAWDEKKAGFCEIDTVSHDGGGEINPHYAWTLTVTDVALGWTEVRALKNKARKWTLEAAEDIAASFPLPIRGLDSDGGGEFINWHFKDWCERRGITFTRGRSHHSTANSFVEPKNGDVVRKTVGYARFEGEEIYAALVSVYRCLCPLLNYFYPSKKLIAKERLPNGRIQKVYEKQLKTPFQRLWEDPQIAKVYKERAIQTKATLDIVALQDNLERACKEIEFLVNKNHG
jgi:transposase InsO family protein